MFARAPRQALYLLPLLVTLALGWSYADGFLHPTFFGDQGTRLDQANRVIVTAGKRYWLPMLQLHVHLLYLLRAPVAAYLLIPYAYTALTLFVLTGLCRAAVPNPWLPTLLVLVAFAGSSFHWIGHALYQEVIVLPLFLALLYLRCFAPQQRLLFVAVLAAGMLTREVFWIWWLGFLLWIGMSEAPTHSSEGSSEPRRPDWPLLLGTVALAVIPVVWLALTHQSPALGRNTGEHLLLDGIAGRTAILGAALVSNGLLVPLLLVAAVYLFNHRNGADISLRPYHLFSLLSLIVIYLYILLFDPWQTSPGNSRMLIPLYAHLLFWTILAWRDSGALDGHQRWIGRGLAALSMLAIVKVTAVITPFVSPLPRTGAAWEPLQVTTSLRGQRESWRTAIEHNLREARRQRDLRVGFVGLERREYLKFWVAPFLYDARIRIASGETPANLDALIAPEDFQAADWRIAAQLHVRPDITRVLLLRSASPRE